MAAINPWFGQIWRGKSLRAAPDTSIPLMDVEYTVKAFGRTESVKALIRAENEDDVKAALRRILMKKNKHDHTGRPKIVITSINGEQCEIDVRFRQTKGGLYGDD